MKPGTTKDFNSLSDFIRNASPEEKERVFRKVIEDSNAQQQAVLDKSKDEK